MRPSLQKALGHPLSRVGGRDHVGSESGSGKGNDAKGSDFRLKEEEILIAQRQERNRSREKEVRIKKGPSFNFYDYYGLNCVHCESYIEV